MIDPETRKLITQAVERSAWDPVYFLRFFFPHWFPSQMPPVHLGLLALATRKVRFLAEYPYAHDFLCEHFRYQADPRNPDGETSPVFVKGDDGLVRMVSPQEHVNEIMPRGFSKTTLNKGLTVYELLTDETTFAVFISETIGHSEAQVSDIKVELEDNEKLRLAYGNQVPTRSESEKWTTKELQLLKGSILVAKGRGGQVRGLTRNGKRPNLIVLDDVEDEDSVATEEQRGKTKNWFYQSVTPAGQLMEGAVGEEWAQKPLKIICIGTMLGVECLVNTLATDPDFSTVRFGAVIDDNTMLWDYKMSRMTYNRMRAKWAGQGQLSGFVREYDSAIRVSDDTVFPSVFSYQFVNRADLVSVSIALDPAISKKKKACHSAIIVAGRHKNGSLWFLDEWGGIGKTASDMIAAFCDLQLKWDARLCGIESVQFQAALLDLVKEEMARRKHFFHVTGILQGSSEKKSARIEGMLSPRYFNGMLHHLRPLPKLETNILDWPNGKVDYMDAGAMALELLGETTGLVMDGALDPEPPQEFQAIPEARIASGNYYLAPSHNSHIASGRYG